MTTLVALLASTGVLIGSRAATTSPVLAWGSNAYRQVGPAAPASSASVSVPVQVSGMDDVTVVSVAAGAGHSLALSSEGKVWSWGRNQENELGDSVSRYLDDVPPRPDPAPVFERSEEPQPPTPSTTTSITIFPTITNTDKHLEGVKAVAAGWFHNLALKDADGTVWSWGENGCGQLGNGRTGPTHGYEAMNPSAAVQVPGLTGVVAVAAGRAHSLALDGTGTLWSWGDDRWGQLGTGRVGLRGACTVPGGPDGVVATRLPTKVPLGLPVLAMAAGSDHSLALTADGTVWSWGNNCAGQLGPGPSAATTSARPVPVPVSGLPAGQVVALAAGGPPGGGYSLALLSDGSDGRVLAWGLPDLLGAGPAAEANSPCEDDPAFANSGGGDDVAATVKAQKAHIDPAQVTGLTNVVALEAGMFHTLAVRGDGKVFAWGRNESDQLGPAGTTDGIEPGLALDGPVSAIGAGSHSLALPGPPPPRPTFGFGPGADDLPVGPGDLPVDEDDLPVDEDDLPLDEDDVPVDTDNPPGDEDVPDDPAGLAGDREGHFAGSGGGVFVTGFGPDVVADDAPNTYPNYGTNVAGARHFVRRAVAYVTPGDAAPRLLFIPHFGYQVRGLQEADFDRCSDGTSRSAPGCFDVAYNPAVYHPQTDGANRNPPDPHTDALRDRSRWDRDLRSVSFDDYDALIVGSELYFADIDVLVARQADLYSYVNAGGGVVAFGNAGDGRADDAADPPYQGHGPDDRRVRSLEFLPFLNQGPTVTGQFGPYVVTEPGRALGLAEGDVNGNHSASFFREPCGFDPLVRSADGNVVTMATRKAIPTPCVGARVPDVRVKEGDGGIVPATFSVSLGTARDTPVRVDYTTIAAGATAGDVCPDPQAGGADYLSTSGTLTFPPGDAGPLTVSVPVCGDRLSESDENFLLRLTSPDDVGLEVTATGTIVDDEPRPPGDDPATGTTPGGGDRGENASQAPVQPTQPVQVPTPAPVVAPAPAVAAAPAVAIAPALAPAPAPAQATSQAQAQQGSQAQAQQGSQAQAGSPAQAAAASPQVGITTDEQRQTQVERASIDGAGDGDTLLASARRPSPVAPVALFGAAVAVALGLGGIRRRPVTQRSTEPVPHHPDGPDPADRRLWLRRARQQR